MPPTTVLPAFFCIHQVNYIDDIAMSWCGVAVTPPGLSTL